MLLVAGSQGIALAVAAVLISWRWQSWARAAGRTRPHKAPEPLAPDEAKASITARSSRAVSRSRALWPAGVSV